MLFDKINQIQNLALYLQINFNGIFHGLTQISDPDTNSYTAFGLPCITKSVIQIIKYLMVSELPKTQRKSSINLKAYLKFLLA